MHTNKYVYELVIDYDGEFPKSKFKLLAESQNDAVDKAAYFGGRIISITSLFHVNVIE